MKKTLLLPLAVLALVAVNPHRPLLAQAAPQLEVGSRIRVSTAGENLPAHVRWVVGTVRETNATQLVMRVAGEGDESAFVIPWDAVERLEVSQGRVSSQAAMKRGMRNIMLPAVLTGLVGGTVFGALRDSEDHSNVGEDPLPGTGHYMVYGTAVGAVAGLLGTVATAAGGEEEWEPVRVQNVRAGVALRPGGIGLAMQLRF